MTLINVRPILSPLAIAWLICGAVAFPVKSAEHRYRNLKEAVSAARNAKDENEMTARYSELSEYSAETPDDVRSLYEAMADLENKIKDKKQAQKTALPVGKLIEKSTDPKHHQVIAELLERENQTLPANYLGSLAPLPGKEDDPREAIHTARLMVLTKAAGDGKNTAALPALRAIYEKGGIAAEFASDAIGKIGDPKDLDNFIETIKNDPKARLSLAPFGGAALDRLSKEIENASLPEDQKQRLIAHLGDPGMPTPGDNSAHALIPKYEYFLHHPKHSAVEIAARTIGMNVKPEDEPLILRMLGEKDNYVRFEALMAIDRVWADRWIPTILNLLKTDSDDNIRVWAALALGRHKVRSSETALREALKDRSPRVRANAQAALDDLSGENERKIQQYLKERKEKSGQ